MKARDIDYMNSSREQKGLTVILPVLNERENLELLVSEIFSLLCHGDRPVEVLVVDDGSSDGTQELVEQISEKYEGLKLIKRHPPKSLPKSIELGIQTARFPNVAWLDADGSMPICDLLKMVEVYESTSLNCVIGSRFVEGGGFKGFSVNSKNHPFEVVRRLHASQDSLIAVILSRILNLFLRCCIRAEIRDLTSGFIVVQKDIFNDQDFIGGYGDYFPRLVWRLKNRNYEMQEFGYICLPRLYGESKTGKNLFQLIKTGIPYFLLGVSILIEQLHKGRKNAN